jgi:hypothetical protein
MMNLFRSKKPQDKKSDFEIEDEHDEEDSAFIQSLQVNLSRLIVYAESADTVLQREVAEKLANEAVKPARQVQIVEYGGLRLLIPLTKSSDQEVQRLAAHALANLSVNAENQKLMAKEGAIESLIFLLGSGSDLIQRQSAKALANLGVNTDNKTRIATAGGIPKLVRLAGQGSMAVKIEAIAALANLAVNDKNEVEIVKCYGLEPIVQGLELGATELNESRLTPKEKLLLEELATQCARALRNLSVNPSSRSEIENLGATVFLQKLANHPNDRISQQSRRALRNLETNSGK